MGRCFAGTQVLGFRVFGVIHFVYLQNLLATDDDERLIQREPQDFIRSKYRAFSNTRGLTKLRCIVGDTPEASPVLAEINSAVSWSVQPKNNCAS